MIGFHVDFVESEIPSELNDGIWLVYSRKRCVHEREVDVHFEGF